MEFFEKLKLMRQEAGLTQEELAAKLHVTRQAISNYELGRGYPSIDILVSIAQLFNVALDELLDTSVKRRQSRIVLALLIEACACLFIAAVTLFFRIQRQGVEAIVILDHALAFLIPVLCALIGVSMRLFPPKMNVFVGYRTPRAFKNNTAWAYAQACAADLFCKLALGLFAASAIYTVVAIFLPIMTDLIVVSVLSGLYAAALVAIIPVIELRLKKLIK